MQQFLTAKTKRAGTLIEANSHAQFRSLAAALALLVGLLAEQPARAQSLTITATGSIPVTCGVTVASPFGAANLNSNGSVGATALVNCNSKYLIKATSANGGLKTATAAPSASFANKLDYTFSISVPLDNSSSTVSGSCTASSLIAGASACPLSPAGTGLSSGLGTSVNQTATLAVTWTLPGATRLVAGSYADTITISIAAQP